MKKKERHNIIRFLIVGSCVSLRQTETDKKTERERERELHRQNKSK